jgi:hypothetical protein
MIKIVSRKNAGSAVLLQVADMTERVFGLLH